MDRIKTATVKQYETAWRAHIKPALGHMPVTKITAVDIQKFLLSIANSAGNASRNVLRGILQQALMAEYVSINVADNKFVLSSMGTHRSKEIYTLSQLTQLDDIMRNCPLEAAYLMQAHAGLRVGESLAVSTDSISFVDSIDGGRVAVIDVSATSTQTGKIAPTKTRAVRYAYMTQPWSYRLEELVHNAMDNGNTYLCGTGARPLSRNDCEDLWNAINLPDSLTRIPMHNLRNSYETYMRWELKQPIEVTSKLLGHKQITTTESHYDRPNDSVLLQAAVDSVHALPKTLLDGTHRDTASL